MFTSQMSAGWTASAEVNGTSGLLVPGFIIVRAIGREMENWSMLGSECLESERIEAKARKRIWKLAREQGEGRRKMAAVEKALG